MRFAEPLPYAAMIAFAAFGAHLLGTGLLILINPQSRAVRWHAAFTFWIMAWLAMQGWFTLGLGTQGMVRVYGWVVHMMPVFFLAAALVETRRVSDRGALAVIAVGVVTADLLNPISGGTLAVVWQALVWGAASVLHFRDRTGSSPRRRSGTGGELTLQLALLVIVPVAVVGVILLGGAFVLYVMPLITIVIQFLIFVGVVHHRFYDIEVRAARSGALATAAAEQERLALLGELAATMAHEIRNPLTGMRSLTQRLSEARVDDERRTRYAGVILGEIERLERFVGSLLDMGRRSVVQDTDPAVTPLEPLFEDLALLVDARAKRAQVAFERDASGLVAAAPRDALAQSLLNLVINALSHTPAGGRVSLSAVPLDDGMIEVRVSDTGPGVPRDEREAIFEPFHTRGLGAGLGLAVVRRLARELDWHIGVDDAPGSGAQFHIRIPAAS